MVNNLWRRTNNPSLPNKNAVTEAGSVYNNTGGVTAGAVMTLLGQSKWEELFFTLVSENVTYSLASVVHFLIVINN